MIKKYLSKKSFIDLLIVFLIFFIDRISKIFVIKIVEKNNSSELFVSKFLNIHLIWNEGVAFGLFSFTKESFYNLLSLLILLLIILIIFMLFQSRGVKKYALLMILGGALGNFFDRIFSKAVPDFIDFHVGDFHWFIFNVADIFITIGVFFMILLEFTKSNEKKKL
tara:strand:+ start:1060 stop:1557 length:498 start_codon:yes stop_codon:yes gene_type:complete